MSQVLIGSIEYRESTQETYSREQGFYSNKFTRHFPMDPNYCLCYPSQPGVTQTFPQVFSPCNIFSAVEGGISVPQGISQPPSLQVQFHSSPATPSGHQKGHAHKWRLPLHQGLWTHSDSIVSDGRGGKQGFGFWPEFIYPVVTSPLLLSTLSP
jgi:hypothetical protein